MSVKEITTGQDSFLDIVANLVGVLIILVVVVGAQAKIAYRDVEPDLSVEAEKQSLRTAVSRLQDQAKKLEIDNHLLEQRTTQEATLLGDLSVARHEMLVQIGIVKKQLEEKKQARLKQFDEKRIAELERLDEQRALESKLASIQMASRAVQHAQPISEVIEHRPNPIARTVFSEEVHFHLKAGKIAFVPFEELVSEMKTEWKVKAEKLRQATRTIETVGPVQDFRLQYELQSEMVDKKTQNGTVKRQAVRFNRFSIVPANQGLGEQVSNSLKPGSAFEASVRRFDPPKTTISIWVYPDSFTEYNQIKVWLHDNGYQVACWPLDFNKRISGGPEGFKTSAQ